ncbi:MAG TPA: DinB family protein [Bryobacteraceae bacterium]|nr:DinB family protein [Bryobacteraceae bacterium]
MPLDPEIAVLITEIDANLSHLESITHGLTPEQFQWSPGPGRWSIAQCIAHLNVANRTSLPAVEEGIAAGRAKGITGAGPFRYGFIATRFAASQEPPATRKFRAPKVFLPPPKIDMASELAEYRRLSAELKRLTRSADGLHLARIKTKMLALPPALRAIVRMPLGGQLHLTTTHDRRHLWQAEQVRNDPAFPA